MSRKTYRPRLRKKLRRGENEFIFVAAMCLGLVVTSTRGGSLDDTGAPTDPASAMYTANDLYNRLASGTNAPKRTGAFTEPMAGPTAGTMPTTDEIMAKAPATNASGAVEGEVLSGQTFWGLTQGAWGTRTGTIAAATLSPANDTVSNGYYAATTLHAVDADLATANIKAGTTIFGITGTPAVVDTTSGDAVAGDILVSKKAWVNGVEVTGNVAAGANLTGECGLLVITITNGLYSGSKTVTASDTDLITGNIRSGINIFGVDGKTEVVDTSSGDAVADDVMSGKKAWVDGAEVTGTIATLTLTNTTAAVAAGYYAATNLAQVATNLAVGNIKKDMNIFGVVGTYEGSGGSATNAPVPKTGQTASYANYDDGWYSTNKGVAWPNPRFSPVAETGAETNQIRDNLTGLIWARDANFAGETKSWQAALDYIAATNASATLYGGATDWRLPNMRELYSLIALQYEAPVLCNTSGTEQWTEGDPFTGVQSDGNYWSSTTHAVNTVIAWYVYLYSGIVETYDKSAALYVWPVRGP